MKFFGGLAIVSIVVFFFWVNGMNNIHFFTSDFYASMPFLLMLGAGIIITTLGISLERGFTSLIGISLIILMVVTAIPANYNRLNHYYNDSVEVAKGVAVDYDSRSPFEVATATSDKSLMDTTGTALATRSLSDEGSHGEWNTLVLKRGMFNGYESIQNMDLPLYGTAKVSDVKFCKFNENVKLRHGGSMPVNNLSRAIYGKVPLNVGWETEDSYGYCNSDNEPIVVTPLTQVKGFLYPTLIYFGVATLNGATGDVKIYTNPDQINKIPGPVYPTSLAALQRQSLTAVSGFTDYLFSASGNEASESNSEVNLRRSGDGESAFVTTLTPRGSSSSIVGVAEVQSSQLNLVNGYNPLVFKKLPDANYRPANSTLADEIRTKYSYMPEMVNESFGVFEITSGKDGGWVASIGREQSVNYRAYITASGEITMVDRSGNTVAQGSVATEVPDENTSEDKAPNVELTPVDGVSDLTDEELSKLGSAILEELSKRASTK